MGPKKMLVLPNFFQRKFDKNDIFSMCVHGWPNKHYLYFLRYHSERPEVGNSIGPPKNGDEILTKNGSFRYVCNGVREWQINSNIFFIASHRIHKCVLQKIWGDTAQIFLIRIFDKEMGLVEM